MLSAPMAPAEATLPPEPPTACTPYFCAIFGELFLESYRSVYPEITTRPSIQNGSEITATYEEVGTIVARVDWRPPNSCVPAPEVLNVTALSATQIGYEMVETYRSRFSHRKGVECRILSGIVTSRDAATARLLLESFRVVWFNDPYYYQSEGKFTLQFEKTVLLRIAPETPPAGK